MPLEERRVCLTCCELLLSNDTTHGDHVVKSRVKLASLRQPSALLPSLDNNKTNAVRRPNKTSVKFTFATARDNLLPYTKTTFNRILYTIIKYLYFENILNNI